jgi:hypothetical protein
MSLTGILDIDILIIEILDCESLISLCLTNKYYSLLGKNEQIWFRLMKRDYIEMIPYKLDGINYKEMYRRLNEGDLYKAIRVDDSYKRVSLTEDAAGIAARNGDLHILKWLYEWGVKINNLHAYYATAGGQIKVLEWLETKNILPVYYGANIAGMNNYINVLDWLEYRNILPTSLGIDEVASRGHINVLKWASKRGIYPSRNDYMQIID